jgi:hypothetical protein
LANHLTIERVGGLAGFGGPSAKIRSRGQVDLDRLSADDRAVVESLFVKHRGAPHESAPDAFSYKITRGGKTIEVPESALPAAITNAVVDELI